MKIATILASIILAVSFLLILWRLGEWLIGGKRIYFAAKGSDQWILKRIAVLIPGPVRRLVARTASRVWCGFSFYPGALYENPNWRDGFMEDHCKDLPGGCPK